MTDYSKMSDADLLIAAKQQGIPITPDYSKMSDEDLMKVAGIQKPLSLSEKIAGVGSNLAQGATFGLGNVASGGYEVAKGLLSGNGKTAGENFKIGKELYDQSRSKYNEQHPVLGTVEEMAGGLPTMMIPAGKVAEASTKAPGLLSLALKGIKSGAVYGGAYGAGSEAGNVIEKPSVESAENMGLSGLKGAAFGGATGAVAVPVATGLSKLIGKGAKGLGTSGVNRVAETLRSETNIPESGQMTTTTAPSSGEIISTNRVAEATPKEKVPGNATAEEAVKEDITPEIWQKSVETNTPMINLVGTKGTALLGTAKRINPEAADIVNNFADSEMKKQPERVKALINNVFGEKSALTNMDDLKASYKAQAAPAYDKAFGHGDMAEEAPELTTLIQKKNIADAIKSAKSGVFGEELQGLPDTHIKVLDAAKQVMDDKIGAFERGGENNQARALSNSKESLINVVDKANPDYANAREIAGDHLKMMEAQNIGGKIIRGESTESLQRTLQNMSEPEKDALKIGLRDELVNQLENSSQKGTENLAYKLFKSSEYNKTRQGLKTILGDDSYNKLITQVDPLIKSGNNISEIMGGSPTVERGMHVAHSLRRMGFSILNKAIGEQTSKKYVDVARIMTDPVYAGERLKALNNSEQKAYITLMNSTGKTSGIIGSKKGE